MVRGAKILITLGVLILSCTPVYADTYSISNNGLAKEKDDIYKDSGLPSSFKGAEYYDVAMPYNLTPFDVGGWCSDANDKAYVKDENYLKSNKLTVPIGYENTMSVWHSDWGTLSQTSDCGLRTITKNGVTFYALAVQKFQFNNTSADAWYGGFSSASNGELIDIILTDGTVIHFIKCDSNAVEHTNGAEDGKGCARAIDTNPSYDGEWWKWEPVKMKQYANIFGVSGCNSLELWSSSSSTFANKYNLGNGDDQNRIAYYRMYHLKITDNWEIANDRIKDVSYKLGDVKLASGETTSGKDTVIVKQTGIYSESKFLDVANLVEKEIGMPNADDLEDDTFMSIVNWRKSIEASHRGTIYNITRVFAMFFGICFVVWVVLIYLAYWLDRTNNFIDIDFLPIITGNKLRISPDESDCTFNPREGRKGEPQTVNHRVIMKVCLLGLTFAIFLLSGGVYDIVNWLVQIIKTILGVL